LIEYNRVFFPFGFKYIVIGTRRNAAEENIIGLFILSLACPARGADRYFCGRRADLGKELWRIRR
jgi:hypothetical protein